MALNFGLNTTDHASLTQVLVATEDGLFDYQAQQAAAKVVVPAAQSRKLAAIRAVKHPVTGKVWLIET